MSEIGDKTEKQTTLGELANQLKLDKFTDYYEKESSQAKLQAIIISKTICMHVKKVEADDKGFLVVKERMIVIRCVNVKLRWV